MSQLEIKIFHSPERGHCSIRSATLETAESCWAKQMEPWWKASRALTGSNLHPSGHPGPGTDGGLTTDHKPDNKVTHAWKDLGRTFSDHQNLRWKKKGY